MWSRTRAGTTYALAHAVCVRLPALGKAMKQGELDLPRAKAFVEWTEGLTDAQAARVCQLLLPRAAGWTVGELVDEIKRACLAVDPEWAERKYRNAVRQRRVAGFRNPDGTANLCGYNQPVDRVAAACARIDALARACKRAGDARKVDHIRSDLFLGMTDGTFEGMDDAQIIAHVLAHPYTADPDPNGSSSDTGDDGGDGAGDKGDGGDGDRPGGGSCGGPASGGPGRGGGSGSGPGGGSGDGRGPRGGSSSGGGRTGPGGGASGPPPGGGAPEGAAGGSAPAGAGHAGHAGQPGSTGNSGTLDRPGQPGQSGGGPAAGGPAPGRAWATPEVRVALATVLGLDERPGQIPGWGPIPAPVARQLVDGMHAAEWRWVVCHPHTGQALAGGLLTTRPNGGNSNSSSSGGGGGGGRARRDAHRGGIVELAATSTDLHQLTTAASKRGEYGGWARVIHAIAAGYEHWNSDGASHGDGGGHGDAHRRLPGARLRRWIQLRDRQCSYPGCRAPAAASDVDHRVDHAAGGLTIPENLHPPCRHDHRVKHDGGWTIHPSPDGAITWVSPLGRRHTTRPPPVIAQPLTPFPRHRDPHWHPIDDQSLLDEPWRPACDCLFHPCPHDATGTTGTTDNTDNTDNTGAEEDATSTSEASADTANTEANPEPPTFDDEPPF